MPCGCVVYILTRGVPCSFLKQGMLWVWNIISAWASALLVLAVMGNAKASSCGTGDGTATHAFSFSAFTRILFLLSQWVGVILTFMYASTEENSPCRIWPCN